MVGEQTLDDGSPIKINTGLRQIGVGDLLLIEWPVNENFGTGNWIKLGLTEIELEELGGKHPGVMRVLKATLHGEAGWHMGAYDAELGDPGASGLHSMTLTPRVRVASIPWKWELRTDDVPGWHAFVIGHNCKLHEGRDCTVAARELVFSDIRARSVRGSEKRE